jgi:hypothetical protein
MSTDQKKEGDKKPYIPTPEMADILKNTVDCGKYTQDELDGLMALATDDPEILNAIKGIIKVRPINPDLVKLKYHPSLIKQAAENTYDHIQKHIPGGLNDLKKSAPELYKAKHFEKFGRLPNELSMQ